MLCAVSPWMLFSYQHIRDAKNRILPNRCDSVTTIDASIIGNAPDEGDDLVVSGLIHFFLSSDNAG